MYKISVFIALLFILFLVSCSKPCTANLAASDYFPHTLGDSWTYNVDDTFGMGFSPPHIINHDVTVSVEGLKTLDDNKDAFILKFHFPDWDDTSYFRFAGDTVKFFWNYPNSDHLSNLKDIFIIPFANIERFSFPESNDIRYSYLVKHWSSYTNQFLHFDDVFDVNRSPLSIFSGQPQEYIFKPNIGFLDFTEHAFFVGYDNFYSRHWKLKSYHLK